MAPDGGLDRGPVSRPASFPAPAKINLFLHITGRRADGYHELQTVFQFLTLADTLELRVRDDGEIRQTRALPGVPAERDLTLRAAHLLQAQAATPLGVDICVTKRIPLGAGLGGGSSDAASTLVALNRLWGIGWDTARLAALGLRLGADVPVFVHGEAAWAEGVGERLRPVTLEAPHYLLVMPGCEVSTAREYGHPALTRDTPPLTIADFLSGGLADGRGVLNTRELLARGANDCEAVVRTLYPEVDAALEWLGRHGVARMTGTGAAVFAPFADGQSARCVRERLPGGWLGIVTRGVNRSPLLDA